jgi:hypothetical protein
MHEWMDGGKGRVLDFGVGTRDIHPTGKESNMCIYKLEVASIAK